jgi:hypothetical protein
MVSSLLEELSVKGDTNPAQEEVIRATGATIFSAGVDTARAS